MDPSIFFPKIDRGPALARQESAAKAVCSGCPVVAACRRHALAVGERHGVWGGLTTTERALQDRRRPRPRPESRGEDQVAGSRGNLDNLDTAAWPPRPAGTWPS